MDRDAELSAAHPDLVAYARARGLPAEDAWDTAQETSARALEQGETFARHPCRRAWLFRVSANLIVDRRRQRPLAELDTDALDPAPGPEATAMLRLELDLAMRALDHLPAKHADLIMWCDVQGRPPRDVAAQLGVSHAVLRQRLHRARAALRVEYRRLGGSVGGLVLLIPNLRRTGRLREVAMAGVLTPVLAVGGISCLGLHLFRGHGGVRVVAARQGRLVSGAVEGAGRRGAPGPTLRGVSEHLTLDEAAARLSKLPLEVLQLIRRGDLYGVKTADGRWLLAARNVDAYLTGQPQSSAP